MNKTFNDFLAELIAEKETKKALEGLSSTSMVSIWRQLFEVVAWVLFNFALALQNHLQEIKDLIAEQKVFNLKRYRFEALRFQYGFDLIEDSDQFKTTYNDNGVIVEASDEQIEASKIVKYAACSRVIEAGRPKIVMKIAPGNIETIFSNDVMTAFGKYIEEIAPAGDFVSIINYLPDILKFSFQIKYDAQILLPNGMHIISGNFPVQDAIENFLKNLPFNGELSQQKLEASILAVDGVVDLVTVNIETKWIDPAVNGYGLWQPLSMSVLPASGRFKVEDYTGLQFVV